MTRYEVTMMECEDTLLQCARLMELSARTAPKSAGQDFIVLRVLDREACGSVGKRMMDAGEHGGGPMFVRDAKGVLTAGAMLLVGVKNANPVGLNCGACGYRTCDGMKAAYKARKTGALIEGEKKDGDGGEEQSDGEGEEGATTDWSPADFSGPICAFRLLDMGIALGSAAKTAGMLNADNRIMYRAGVVAMEMGLLEADYVMAIPLTATGKSVFFDR
jgi:uncharacterized ferredoxin-like protein